MAQLKLAQDEEPLLVQSFRTTDMLYFNQRGPARHHHRQAAHEDGLQQPGSCFGSLSSAGRPSWIPGRQHQGVHCAGGRLPGEPRRRPGSDRLRYAKTERAAREFQLSLGQRGRSWSPTSSIRILTSSRSECRSRLIPSTSSWLTWRR